MKQIVFLHIPRTGGTSISNLFYSFFFPFEIYDCRNRARTQYIAYNNFLELDIKEQLKFKCVTGHININFIKSLQYPILSFTVFRNPIDRVISIYNHILSNKYHHLYSIRDKGIDYLLHLETYPNLHNGITRLFIFEEIPLKKGFYSKKMIKQAYSNIKKYMNYYNTFDNLKEVYNWVVDNILPYSSWDIDNLPELLRLNKSKKREVPDLTSIIENNLMDIELWEQYIKK